MYQMEVQSNIKSYTILQLKSILYSFAHKTQACEESLDRIKMIRSLKDFEMFLEDFYDSIDERILLSYAFMSINNLTPELICQYMDSPFVSDYDKQRVKEVICRK